MSDTEKSDIAKWINSITDKRLQGELRRKYFPSEQEKALKENLSYICT